MTQKIYNSRNNRCLFSEEHKMQGIEMLKVGSTYTVNSYDFEQFIPTNAHRHMMSIVYFINSLPQYVFRRAYIAIANKRNY